MVLKTWKAGSPHVCSPDLWHSTGHSIQPNVNRRRTKQTVKPQCVKCRTHSRAGVWAGKKGLKSLFQSLSSNMSELCVDEGGGGAGWMWLWRHREAFQVDKNSPGRKFWRLRRVKLWPHRVKRRPQTETDNHPFCYSSQQRASTAEVAPSANSSKSLRVQIGPCVRALSRQSSGDLSGIARQPAQPSTASSKILMTFSSVISKDTDPSPHPHLQPSKSVKLTQKQEPKLKI